MNRNNVQVVYMTYTIIGYMHYVSNKLISESYCFGNNETGFIILFPYSIASLCGN